MHVKPQAGMELVLAHSGPGPAASNTPLTTSQRGKTAFARDHPLGTATLRPLCAGRREQPVPSLPCRAGPQERLVPGSRDTGRNDPHTCWESCYLLFAPPQTLSPKAKRSLSSLLRTEGLFQELRFLDE